MHNKDTVKGLLKWCYNFGNWCWKCPGLKHTEPNIENCLFITSQSRHLLIPCTVRADQNCDIHTSCFGNKYIN